LEAQKLVPLFLSGRIDGRKGRKRKKGKILLVGLLSNLGVSPTRECNFGVDLLSVQLVRG
jgi:hypothetical protein